MKIVYNTNYIELIGDNYKEYIKIYRWHIKIIDYSNRSIGRYYSYDEVEDIIDGLEVDCYSLFYKKGLTLYTKDTRITIIFN